MFYIIFILLIFINFLCITATSTKRSRKLVNKPQVLKINKHSNQHSKNKIFFNRYTHQNKILFTNNQSFPLKMAFCSTKF